jgi:uncharacterized protein YqhQ
MPKEDFLSVGGQAIVEGVMMRSPKYFAVACRAPNGELIIKSEPIEKTWIGRQKWLKVPFIRGSWALLDAMTLGTRAMKFASDVQLAPEYQKVEEAPIESADSNSDSSVEGKPEPVMNKKIQDGIIITTLVVSLAFAIFIFKFVPQIAGTVVGDKTGLGDKWKNFTVEVVKIVFFIGYLAAISRLEGVKEVFRYHGAEHKAINALEAELPLTMENCRAQTRLHPRCGTSFAIIVLILGLLIFPFVPRFESLLPQFKGKLLPEVFGNFGMHLVILPFIAGFAYELLRFAGKFRDNSTLMILFKPGLWTQLITTQEPEDKHIEVALASLEACMNGERSMKESIPSPQ